MCSRNTVLLAKPFDVSNKIRIVEGIGSMSGSGHLESQGQGQTRLESPGVTASKSQSEIIWFHRFKMILESCDIKVSRSDLCHLVSQNQGQVQSVVIQCQSQDQHVVSLSRQTQPSGVTGSRSEFSYMVLKESRSGLSLTWCHTVNVKHLVCQSQETRDLMWVSPRVTDTAGVLLHIYHLFITPVAQEQVFSLLLVVQTWEYKEVCLL